MPRGWEGNRRSGVALVVRHVKDSVVYPPTGSAANVWEMSTLPSPPGVLPLYLVFWTVTQCVFRAAHI